MKALCISCVLFASALAASAQQPVITPETPVNSPRLHEWLQSADPRLIAWAADFARRTHDAAALTEMAEVIEHWKAPQFTGTDESEFAQRRAAMALLDALIQEDVHPPVATIRTVAESFPEQALVLAGRLPLSESRGMLDSWTRGETRDPSGLLARVASMMLAKEPGSSFVARVVAASEESLIVSVTSGDVGSGTGGGSCGDSGGRPIFQGWPQVYRYELVENDPNANALPVVDLDGDRIDVVRVEENEGWGSCGDQVERLDPTTRHRLIAHWLGVRDEEMSWRPVEQTSIIWTNKTDYEAKLGAAIEAERQKLRETVELLHRRGLLNDNDAQSSMPRLVVTVSCDLKPCPLN